jgi:hypothetical protein
VAFDQAHELGDVEGLGQIGLEAQFEAVLDLAGLGGGADGGQGDHRRRAASPLKQHGEEGGEDDVLARQCGGGEGAGAGDEDQPEQQKQPVDAYME